MDLRLNDEFRPVDEDAYLRDFIRAVEHKDFSYVQFVVPIIKDQQCKVLQQMDTCGHYLQIAKEDSSRYNYILSHGLILAAHHGAYEISKYLISQDTKVNYGNLDGDTALIKACERGHLDVVSLLLKSGAKVNQTNNVGSTALQWVTRNPERSAVVELLLAQTDIDVNLASHKRGKAALHCAAELDTSGRITKQLLDKNANVNQQAADGVTPLHLAVERGLKHNVQLLIEYGAHVNIQDNLYGSTALHIAMQHGHVDLVTILLNAGADLKIQDNCGRTARERLSIYSKLQRNEGKRTKFGLIERIIEDEAEKIYQKRVKTMDRMFSDICERILECKWTPLFEELFQGYDTLEEAIGRVPIRTNEASLSVLLEYLLHQWVELFPHTATFWVLMRALRDHDMKLIADMMIEVYWSSANQL